MSATPTTPVLGSCPRLEITLSTLASPAAGCEDLDEEVPGKPVGAQDDQQLMGHAKNFAFAFGHYVMAGLSALKRECVESVALPIR